MKRYKINYESVPHGVISWRHDGADAVYCEAGVEVRITWQPSAGWGLSEAHYTDAQGNEVAINTKEMAFTMPESDITIGGTFKRFVVTDWEGYEGGGGGGTTDYNGLDNKPKINDVTLEGNKTSEQLGIVVPKRIKDDPTGEGVIEGYLKGNKASGLYSHAEGGGSTNLDKTVASGHCSHAEGNSTTASGIGSHAEGRGTKANGRGSHAEGQHTEASGEDSHAEGKGTTASGQFSHAEGKDTKAIGAGSHAEGNGTTASGTGSHAEGLGTKANGAYQRVFGKFNDSALEGDYAEIVGNGTSDDRRRNARTLSWDGKEWLADTLEVSREPETENEVATKGYVDGKAMKRVVVDEEKLIGEWVEGGVAYDLFEKIINFGALTNATQKSVEHGVTNFVRLVGMEGIAVSSSNILPLPTVTIDPTKCIYLACGAKNITIMPGSDRSAFNAWVTLRFIREQQQ